MQTDQITAALDAANIRHTPEAIAMLAECNAPAIDYEQYREAVSEGMCLRDDALGSLLIPNTKMLVRAHPHMPETKVMQARIAELEASVAMLIGVVPDDTQIKRMAERFLSWKLPADFNPDGGISFVPDYNVSTEYPGRHEPIGTNLLSYTQAESMVRHMLDRVLP